MKKWLIGCLVTGFILVLLGGAAGYWFVWRPLSAAGGDWMGKVDDLKKIGEAEKSVKNQSEFSTPTDGKLSAAQVNAFITIQQTIYDQMGPDFALMEEKYKKLNDQGGKSDASAKDVMGAFGDMTGLMAKAKQAQVAALNVQNMSTSEYRWIREQVSAALPYIAIDVPAVAPDATTTPDANTAESSSSDGTTVADAAVNDAMAKAKEAAAKAMKESIPGGQAMGDAMQGPQTEAERANVEMLRPHKELLFKTMTTAWLSM